MLFLNRTNAHFYCSYFIESDDDPVGIRSIVVVQIAIAVRVIEVVRVVGTTKPPAGRKYSE